MDVLFNGKSLKVVSKNGWEVVQESDLIWALPLLVDKFGNYKILVRLEPCPSYQDSDKLKYYCTILSGTKEPGESSEETLLREIKEESGITSKPDKISILVENIPVCKTTNMRTTLFVVEYSGFNYEEPKGDGSKIEEMSKTIAVPLYEMDYFLDTHVHDMTILSGYNILMNKYFLKT